MRYSLVLIALSSLLVACGSETPPSHSEQTSPGTEMTSLERGAIMYKRCRACHTLGEGERNRVGPNLWQVFGKTAGSREDFNYSSAMANSGIVWTEDTISAYLEDPAEYIPGNRMSFAGLRKDEDRAAVIEYLKANTGAQTTASDAN